MISIRRRLVIALLTLLAVAGAASALAFYFKIRDEANTLFDYHLEQMALSLRDQTLAQNPAALPDETQYDFVVQIWDATGERVYFSHPHSVLPNRAQLGFETVATSAGAWRVFSIQLRDRTIQVAQPIAVRQQLARSLALRTLLPFTLLIPLVGGLIWLIVGRGLRPLGRVADDVGNRSADLLTPLPVAALPVEIKPLVDALNGLLARLARSIEAQRAFVADAAHELRTPLAAVQLQVQLAERAKTDESRQVAFAHLKEGVARSVHLVQQLLTLARQESNTSLSAASPVELGNLAQQVIAEQAALADAKDIDLGITGSGTALVLGDSEALRSMLSNLISNAIRYTGEHGKIDVSVGDYNGQPSVSVTDNGLGIPPADRERVLDRFYRAQGADAEGSGLGLAIVKKVVARHGGELTLADGDAGVGLRVTIRFPAKPKPLDTAVTG